MEQQRSLNRLIRGSGELHHPRQGISGLTVLQKLPLGLPASRHGGVVAEAAFGAAIDETIGSATSDATPTFLTISRLDSPSNLSDIHSPFSINPFLFNSLMANKTKSSFTDSPNSFVIFCVISPVLFLPSQLCQTKAAVWFKQIAWLVCKL